MGDSDKWWRHTYRVPSERLRELRAGLVGQTDRDVAVELLGAAERMAGEIERMRAALDVSGAQANLAERVLDVERVLEDVGCDCACDHASVEEHEPECRPCVACRVAHALWP